MIKKINEFRELQKKKGKKGFSMIELIIVIAIMAILVALIGTQLIPYLEKSREKRDMTTLDTCLTALETVVAEDESITVSDGATISSILGTSTSTTVTATTAFEEYAGLKLSATPFKSDNAGASTVVGDITVQVTDNVITGVTAAADSTHSLAVSRN